MTGEEKRERINFLHKHIEKCLKLHSDLTKQFDEVIKGTEFKNVIVSIHITDAMSALNDEMYQCKEEILELDNNE